MRQQSPDGQLLSVESQPSGVRLVFRTTATTIDPVTHPTWLAYGGAARPRGRADVYVDDVELRNLGLGGSALVDPSWLG